MGFINKIGDSIIKGATQAETLRLPYAELANIVDQEFIRGADDAFLKKVKKTAKGGGLFFNREMKSKNERFDFHVGTRPYGLAWLPSKPVWVFDREENKFYQLDKNLKWKKFYKAVLETIKTEKENRNK